MQSDELERLAKERPVEWLAKVTQDEKFMAKVSQEAVARNLAKGIPVCLADDIGVYQLYPDGSKKYVEYF